MFRHKEKKEGDENKISYKSDKKDEEKVEVSEAKDASPEALRELLEKNLKWSQIIYEQNRRINRKLLWTSIAEWIRILIIAVPIVLGILYLPPLVKRVWSEYGDLLGVSRATDSYSPSTIDRLLQLLPVNPAEQGRIKSLLK